MNNEQSTIIGNDYKYKIVFLGDSSVGKTSLVECIMYGSSKQNHQPTICLQSAKKLVNYHNQIYKLMLWDTAGQEKFNSLIPSFVRGCDCAIIVYDVTNRKSFQNCQKWIKMVRNERPQYQAPIILVSNKNDQNKLLTTAQAFDLAIKNKLAFVETSAKNARGIEKLIEEIVENMEKTKFKSEKQTKSSEADSDKHLQSSRKLQSKKNISISKFSSPNLELKIKQKSSCCSI